MTEDQVSPQDAPATKDVATEPGPRVLAERSLLGIFVHWLAFIPIMGIGLAAVIYLLSSHSFTRANARNALNWHLTVMTLFVAPVLIVVGGDTLPVPEWPAVVLALPLVVGGFFATLLSLVYFVIAPAKAIFGTVWSYPFAYEFVGRSAES